MEPENGPFEFVLHEPNVALSRASLSKIRRHAMRAVGAARQRPGEMASARPYPLQRRLLPPTSLSGLELLIKDYGLDPMDLSALESVHIGTVASATIRSQPSQLGRVLSCRQHSYMAFVPPRFGHIAALDDAFRCLVTAAHSTLVTSGPRYSDRTLACYDKALRSLQSAVDDPRARQKPEILCAVSLLALFEIIHPSNEQLWENHIVGASLLVQLREPQQFTSDFDRALITGLWYPISAEALLNNRKCFLDDPAWAEVVAPLPNADEDFTDRSPLGFGVKLLMAKIPGLAKQTSHVVAAAARPDGYIDEEDLSKLVAEAHSLRLRVGAWRRDFNTALIHALDRTGHHAPESAMARAATKRYELLGVSIVVHMLVDRMLISLSPARDQGGMLLEDEVLALAAEVKQVLASVPPTGGNHRANFVLRQKVKIADAVIATHASFRSALERADGRFVEPWVLKGFCQTLGRKCCDGGRDCCS